jgi:regulatory factor X-associated ankyrin-containing protein
MYVVTFVLFKISELISRIMSMSELKNLDMEVASVLAYQLPNDSLKKQNKPDVIQSQETPACDYTLVQDGADKKMASRSATVLTNVTRGNTAAVTPGLSKNHSVHQLAGQGELEMLKDLFKQIEIDELDSKGYSPLHWACAHNQFRTVKFLIDKGANINIKGNNGETALAFAASKGFVNIVNSLLEACNYCDIDAVNIDGNNALMYAIKGGHIRCVEILLQHGASITHRNNQGKSPFDIAVIFEEVEIQKLLEKHILNLIENS